ncbi:MAG: DNA alkylation repair protein [Clostridia bacterium]|nr:DNA alkylation repair protein [Clostridia bacterium]
MNEIREKLFSLADEEYQKFHGSLCPGTNNIMGVRVPVLRNFAKEIVKKDWKTYLKNADDDYYEEVMLQGMVIGLAKMELKERLEYVEKFVPKIDNWAVCDVTCAGFKFTKKYTKEVWKFLKSYLKSSKEFEIRFGVVMLLDFYITEEYIEDLLTILNGIHHDGYYVKMAVAWAISICYIKFPKETFKLLEKNDLDSFTYNKALQKIIESYRVSKEDKEKMRVLKRENEKNKKEDKDNF